MSTKSVFYYDEVANGVCGIDNMNRCSCTSHHEHFNEPYTVGPCASNSHCPHCCGNVLAPVINPVTHTTMPYLGSVVMKGVVILFVTYTDAAGTKKEFNIIPGQTYVVKALSATKGVCTFTGKIVDYNFSTGIDKLINSPHEAVSIDSIIMDCSGCYDSNLIQIPLNKMISIMTPEEAEQQQCPCGGNCGDTCNCGNNNATVDIVDPFEGLDSNG